MPASDPWPPTLLGEEPSGDFTASGFANEASPTGYTDQSDSCAKRADPLFAPPLFCAQADRRGAAACRVG